MNSRDFLFWLHGFFELTEASTLTEFQTTEIKRHIAIALQGEGIKPCERVMQNYANVVYCTNSCSNTYNWTEDKPLHMYFGNTTFEEYQRKIPVDNILNDASKETPPYTFVAPRPGQLDHILWSKQPEAFYSEANTC